VRVHEPLSVMDFLDVTGGGHSWPIMGAMERIAESQSGVIVLLHRPETAEALLERINPMPVASRKYDLRDYGIGAQICATSASQNEAAGQPAQNAGDGRLRAGSHRLF